MIRGISYIVEDFVVANYATMLQVLYVNNNGLFGRPVNLKQSKPKASFLSFRARSYAATIKTLPCELALLCFVRGTVNDLIDSSC